jgi:peptide/nickel transport system permease protein
LPAQYGHWLLRAVHGDFGADYFGAPILPAIMDRVPRTLILVGFSFVLQELIALPLGILAALTRRSPLDRAVSVLTYLGLALPAFWLSLVVIFIFAVKLAWLPPGGLVSTTSTDPVMAAVPEVGSGAYWAYVLAHPLPTLADLFYHLLLPAFTLALAGIAAESRLMRQGMLKELATDYVRTARAKGLSRRAVVLKHALRNALLPVITDGALYIPALFSGAVVVETIFAWQGVGQYFIAELQHRDYNALLVILLLTGLLTLFANLAADLVYGIVDPRIQYE